MTTLAYSNVNIGVADWIMEDNSKWQMESGLSIIN